MIPGKKYTPEDYLRMAWRRKWIILIPGVLIGVATVIYTHQLPNRYKASTMIMIVPQQVPEDMVRSTVTARVDDRLNMISQEILSRTRLERIIQELNLYQKEREKGAIMQDLVERMRLQDIRVQPIASRSRLETDAFTVSYESEDPKTAVAVATRLADAFVNSHIQDRASLADATSAFLENHVEDARRRLMEKEKELQEYRTKHAGQLPTEVSSNLQMMQTTQIQIQGLMDSMTRDQDQLQRLDLEQASILARTPRESSGEAVATMSPARKEWENAKVTLRALELRYRPNYPDVQRQKDLVEQLRLKVEAEDLQQPVSSASPGAAATLPPDAQLRLAQIQLDRKEIDNRLRANREKEAELNAAISRYKVLLAAAPARESELVDLMRDYGVLQQSYTELLRKSYDSKLSVNLERREIGERFKTLEGARIPERPVSPNRADMNVKGLMAGLGLGLALAIFLEYRDTSVKTDVDVVTTLTLPVLAVIPVMLTEREERRRARIRRVYLWAGAAAVVVIALATVAAWQLGWIDRLVN